jgi:hypothetical protein
MFKIASVGVFEMTKELAVKVSSLEPVPGERSITKQRITHLEREIDQGLVTTFKWVTAEIKGQSCLYRINGQHTSKIFANGRTPCGTVVLEHYICDNIDDIVSLWSRFDPTISSRSKTDVLRTAFQSDGDLRDLPVKQSQTAAKAAGIVEFGFGYTNKVANFDKAQAAIKHKDFVIWACQTFQQSGTCMRVGVFVAAFKTFSESKEMASNFWREVQDGSNTSPTSGSRALQRLLLEYSVNTGNGARTGKKSLRWDQMAELCLSAWQSWRQGRQVQSLKLSKSGLSRFMSVHRGDGSSSIDSSKATKETQ